MNTVCTKVYIDSTKLSSSARAVALQTGKAYFEKASITFEFILNFFKSSAFNMYGHMITGWMVRNSKIKMFTLGEEKDIYWFKGHSKDCLDKSKNITIYCFV